MNAVLKNEFSKPLVSIDLPTFSRSETLIRALDSLNAQTYPFLEIVLIDDNGKGTPQQLKTQQRVENYQPREGVIINYIVRTRNGGGALARNTGIEAAHGDFIAFLDDDDEYLPRKVELQMAAMDDPAVALSYVHCKAILKSGKEIYYRRICNGRPLFEHAYCGCIAATSQWLVRKSALLEVGCFSDTPAKQDSILLYKLLLAGWQIRCIPEVLSVYHDDMGVERISTSGKALIGEMNYDRLIRGTYKYFSFNEKRRVEHAMRYRVGALQWSQGQRGEAIKQMAMSFLLSPGTFMRRFFWLIGHALKLALK